VATSAADPEELRRLVAEMREQRRVLLAGRGDPAATSAAEKLHHCAVALSRLLEPSSAWAGVPLSGTNAGEQERSRALIEHRLMDAVRWTAYFLAVAPPTAAEADGADETRRRLEPAVGGEVDAARLRRTIDAQVDAAEEIGRFLRCVERLVAL
jgi:hypothetical protein